MPDPERPEPRPRNSRRPRPDSSPTPTPRALLLAAIALTALSAAPGRAQEAWVADKEVTLTLRTGAGTQYRIIGNLETGDVATILAREEDWTKVRTEDGKEGWVSAGFLQSSPPAQVELERMERETEELRRQVADLTKTNTDLRSTTVSLEEGDEDQRLEIDRLTRENYELRAEARWPEWITGAGIVLVGMGLGAMLGRNAGRRRQPRVRL